MYQLCIVIQIIIIVIRLLNEDRRSPKKNAPKLYFVFYIFAQNLHSYEKQYQTSNT